MSWSGIKEWWATRRAQLRYPLGSFFGWLATVIGLLSGAAALVEYSTRNTTLREWVLSMALVSMTAVSLGTLAYREVKLSRKSKLAGTLTHQQRASDLIRDLRIYLRGHADAAGRPADEVLARAQDMIEEILSAYADIFSILTSTRCRTCVKLVDFAPNDPTDIAIFTLARDQLSSAENRGHDKRRARERLDLLSANSDFVQLWDPEIDDDGYYFCKDLRAEQGLETSSLNYWWNVAGNPNKGRATWPLWYRSTIVWAVRQEQRNSLGIDRECLGFVTVDSHLPNVFSREDHAPLGKMLANSLLPIVSLYRNLSAGPRVTHDAN